MKKNSPRIPNWVILILILLVFILLFITKGSQFDKKDIRVTDVHICVNQNGAWENISNYRSTDLDKYVCGVVAIKPPGTIELTVSIYEDRIFSFQPIEWHYLRVVAGSFRADIPDNLIPGKYRVIIGTARSDFATLRFAVEE